MQHPIGASHSAVKSKMSSRARMYCGHCGNGPMERRHLKVFEKAPSSQSTLNVVKTFDLQRAYSVESTVTGASTVQPLDRWTHQCPTIGQMDTALSDHWTVGHSTVQPLDSWKQHCPSCTKHWPTISSLFYPFSQFSSKFWHFCAKAKNPNCPTEDKLSTSIACSACMFVVSCLYRIPGQQETSVSPYSAP